MKISTCSKKNIYIKKEKVTLYILCIFIRVPKKNVKSHISLKLTGAGSEPVSPTRQVSGLTH